MLFRPSSLRLGPSLLLMLLLRSWTILLLVLRLRWAILLLVLLLGHRMLLALSTVSLALLRFALWRHRMLRLSVVGLVLLLRLLVGGPSDAVVASASICVYIAAPTCAKTGRRGMILRSQRPR